MKKIASAFVLFCAALAILQWWQIGYRLHLFYVHCKSELNVNHIGDGDFILIYVANAFWLLMAASSIRIFRSEKRWRNTALIIGSINLAGWLALILMHQAGILVEYSEFVGHMKGIN